MQSEDIVLTSFEHISSEEVIVTALLVRQAKKQTGGFTQLQ